MFSEIRTAIINKINNDLKKIEVAYRTDRSSFDGFPAAVVSPSENEADYASTGTDKIVYAFKVRIYYPIKDGEDQDPAEIALEEALEEALTAFRKRDALGNLPFTSWLQPVPSVWEYEERGDGTYRMAELTLRITANQPNLP